MTSLVTAISNHIVMTFEFLMQWFVFMVRVVVAAPHCTISIIYLFVFIFF